MEAHPPKTGESGPVRNLETVLASIPMDADMKKRLAYDVQMMERCHGGAPKKQGNKESSPQKTQETEAATPTPVPVPTPTNSQAEVPASAGSPSTTPANPWRRKPAEREPKKKASDYQEILETIYGDFICGGKIIPPPLEKTKMAERTIRLITFSLKTRRMVQVTKEAFEEAILSLGFPTRQYVRGGFATWDILLNTKEDAEKIWLGDWNTKHLRLHPEYMGRRKTQVTVHNVPFDISDDHLGGFFSQYGDVDEVSPVVRAKGFKDGDYTIIISVDKKQFLALPDTIQYDEDTQLSVLVRGRIPSCWQCKERGHIARVCPRKSGPTQGVAAGKTTTKTAAPEAPTELPKTTAVPAAEEVAEVEDGWKVVGPKKGAKAKKVEATSEEEMEVVPKVIKRKKEESQDSAEEEREEKKETRREERKKARRAKKDPAPKSPIKAATTSTNPSPQKEDGPKNPGAAKTNPTPEKENTPTKVNSVPEPNPTPEPKPGPSQENPPPETKSTPSSQPNIKNKPPDPPENPQTRARSSSRGERREEVKGIRRRSLSPQTEPKIDKRPNPNICRFMHPLAALSYTKIQSRRLAPLKKFKEIDGKDVEQPQLFPRSRMVVSFVRTRDAVCRPIWDIIGSANYAIPGTRLVNHSKDEFRKINRECQGRTAIYLHPSFYRVLKLAYPSMVGGIMRNGELTNELTIGNLGQTFATLTREDFGL